jgi:fructose-1,6-bisphosphatase/inositol monophosphatase family enzyme
VLTGLAADLVTETDQAVEKFVIGALKERYPDYEYALLLYCVTLVPAS